MYLPFKPASPQLLCPPVAYQQWLIREREPRCCFEAFLDNNRFGMGVFAGLLADYFVTP